MCNEKWDVKNRQEEVVAVSIKFKIKIKIFINFTNADKHFNFIAKFKEVLFPFVRTEE